ncbi:hypothetical protein JTE90_019889 [Oedothorax gibbosus]|uniref:BTB domain-containing protein n=1 Tax=Oedothorax gibbosus TaxID=931172 RepID=A0AAV6W0I1_9ARAC|nr:hypothetical protein JTE90_019889 [Oedothorax gibbosus]
MDSCKTDKKSEVCGDSSKVVSAKASSQLSEDFNNLMVSDVLTDIVLKCAGEELHVHKCILAARSPVFAAMFRNDMNEAQSNSVDITDIDSEILRKVVRYIYSGQIYNFTDAMAEDLLYAADKYQLDLLKEICIENMKWTLSMDNVIDVLVIGELHDQNLKDYVMDWICKYPVFSELKKMDKWKMLEKSYPTLAIEVVTTVVEYLQNFKSSTRFGIQPLTVNQRPPVAYRYSNIRYPQQYIPQTYHQALAQQQSAMNQYGSPFYYTLNVQNPLLRPQIFQQAVTPLQAAQSVTRSQAAQSIAQPHTSQSGTQSEAVQSVTQPEDAQCVTESQTGQSVTPSQEEQFVTKPHTSQSVTQPQAAQSVTRPQALAQQQSAINQYGSPFYYTLNMQNPLLRPQIFQQAVTPLQAAQFGNQLQVAQSVTQPQAARCVNPPPAAESVIPQAVTQPQKVAHQEAAVHVEGQEPLTASMLANASAEEQRQMIGDRLFPVIHLMQPYRAGKITGMLLEFENNELLNMLEHHELLKSKVEEAVTVLNEADKEQVNQKGEIKKKSKKKQLKNIK